MSAEAAPVSPAFAAATAVERISDELTAASPGAPGSGEGRQRFVGRVHPGWDIGGNANGGYLMAIAGRAMTEALGRPPVTLTAHFLRPGPAGACMIDVQTVRSGRRFATARATLDVEGKPTLELLGTFGDQAPDADGPRYAREAVVDLPPYENCAAMPPSSEGPGPGLMDRLACRLMPGDDGFRRGEPTGDPTVRGWFALAAEEPIDAIGLLLAADAFPPPVFNTDLPVGWVPTVELTVHVRGVPTPGPLRCVFRSRFVHDGLVDEEGEIWDSSGALVAQSRQLSLTPR